MDCEIISPNQIHLDQYQKGKYQENFWILSFIFNKSLFFLNFYNRKAYQIKKLYVIID